MAIFSWEIEQGSAAWFQMRATIPTASEFDQIITPKRMDMAAARWKYACRIIAGRLLNWQAESLDRLTHIEAGKTKEPFAVAQLEAVQEISTTPVGFVRTNDLRFGASPDRVTGLHVDMGGVTTTIEVKAPTIPKQFEYLLLDVEDAYRCQVQGQLWVCEADKAIFYSYNERMPACLRETGRDDAFMAKLGPALEQFSDELEALTEKAKSLGMYQAFENVLPPLDAALAENDGAAMARIIEQEPNEWRGWGG